MKKLIVLLSLGTLAAVGSIVHAQTRSEVYDYPVNITIESPTSGAMVDRVFTVSGNVKPESNTTQDTTPLSVMIDGKGYIDPRDRGVPEGRDSAMPGMVSNNRFSFTVDLSGVSVITTSGAKEQVAPGRHELIVFGGYGGYGRSQAIMINVTGNSTNIDQRDDSIGRTTPVPGTAATSTSTPTASNDPIIGADREAESTASSPVWWVVLGALVGAGLLGFAEWSAYVYHRRHPKTPARR